MDITLMTPKEAAHLLRCSPKTVRRLVNEGEIVGYNVRPRLMVVDYESIEDYLGRQQVVPSQKHESMGYTPGEKLV